MYSDTIIFDFHSKNTCGNWQTINDVVMGGLSNSKFVILEEGSASFNGFVSLENNGGFASVKTFPQNFYFEGYSGILLRVKGDGKNYNFRLKTDSELDGINYQLKFLTKNNKWEEIRLPFSDFAPTFRGRLISPAPVIDLKSIKQIGFLIGDKQEGKFNLQIDWIKAYK
jgi:monofunctional biosynthetic peptidoglycan transglycosylase